MKQRDVFSLSMASGEVERVLVDGGSEVVVVAGRACVRQPPCWLAEQTVRLVQTLDEGAQLVIGDGGWIEFSALESCRLLVLPPPARAWKSWLPDCWQKLRNVFDVDQGRSVPTRTESRLTVLPDLISKEP